MLFSCQTDDVTPVSSTRRDRRGRLVPSIASAVQKNNNQVNCSKLGCIQICDQTYRNKFFLKLYTNSPLPSPFYIFWLNDRDGLKN